MPDPNEFVSERFYDYQSEQQYEDYLSQKALLTQTVRTENQKAVKPLIEGISKLISILGM